MLAIADQNRNVPTQGIATGVEPDTVCGIIWLCAEFCTARSEPAGFAQFQGIYPLRHQEPDCVVDIVSAGQQP